MSLISIEQSGHSCVPPRRLSSGCDADVDTIRQSPSNRSSNLTVVKPPSRSSICGLAQGTIVTGPHVHFGGSNRLLVGAPAGLVVWTAIEGRHSVLSDPSIFGHDNKSDGTRRTRACSFVMESSADADENTVAIEATASRTKCDGKWRRMVKLDKHRTVPGDIRLPESAKSSVPPSKTIRQYAPSASLTMRCSTEECKTDRDKSDKHGGSV